MLADTLRQTHLPYCLLLQEDGRYVITNRNYKPIGFMTGQWIDYDQYPVAVRLKGMTQELLAKLDYRGHADSDRIYLYGDGCSPDLGEAEAQAYFQRLALLMTLKVVKE